MELIGILIFIFGLTHSFYKDYRKKLEAGEKAAAKRFDASNQPSRMSENGVARQRNTRQMQTQQTSNRQTQNTSRGRQQENKKPKTLADYLAKAQAYLDEVEPDAQMSFEEVKAEKVQANKQNKQKRNAGQQNRSQQYAKQNQAMRAQKRQYQHATIIKQAEGGQSTALAGEGTGWDKSDVYADARGYSAEGSRSNEGSVSETAMSNGDYLGQEMAANDLELGKALQQMDEMYDREANRLDRELRQLFKEMEDPGKDLLVTTESKKKSRNPREILALSNQNDLKRGILLKEILDKPVAKR